MIAEVPEIATGRGNAPPGLSYADDVVLLHGFMGAPWTMRFMAAYLRRQGFVPWPLWYESWATSFEGIVRRLCAMIERHGLGRDRPVHFVGHSMGGLIARVVVARLSLPAMGRMVMLGTPNGGSEIADFCTRTRMLRPLLGRAGPALVTQRTLPMIDHLPPPDYPVGIIAGDRPVANLLRIIPPPHDGKVSVASTHLQGETDHVVLPVSHAPMPFSGLVHRQTAHFLREGRFA